MRSRAEVHFEIDIRQLARSSFAEVVEAGDDYHPIRGVASPADVAEVGTGDVLDFGECVPAYPVAPATATRTEPTCVVMNNYAKLRLFIQDGTAGVKTLCDEAARTLHLIASPPDVDCRPGAAMKRYRQSVILDLLDREPIASQEVLRQRLHAHGIEATQATLSRDLKELRLVKRAADGAYQRPGRDADAAGDGDGALRRTTLEYLRRVERVQQFLVLRTDPGEAQLLALAIDRAALTDVVGTIAGDDTILVVVRHSRRAQTLLKELDEWVRQKR